MLANLRKPAVMVRLHCRRVEANLLQKPFGIVNHVEPKQSPYNFLTFLRSADYRFAPSHTSLN